MNNYILSVSFEILNNNKTIRKRLDHPFLRSNLKIKLIKIIIAECNKLCSAYDTKEKVWRHLDFFHYKAFMQGFQE